jgi:hypothetical protein
MRHSARGGGTSPPSPIRHFGPRTVPGSLFNQLAQPTEAVRGRLFCRAPIAYLGSSSSFQTGARQINSP